MVDALAESYLWKFVRGGVRFSERTGVDGFL